MAAGLWVQGRVTSDARRGDVDDAPRSSSRWSACRRLRAEVLLRRRVLSGLGSEELAGRPVVAGRAEELHRQPEPIRLPPPERVLRRLVPGGAKSVLDALLLGSVALHDGDTQAEVEVGGPWGTQ
jgi:hypothetical protein